MLNEEFKKKALENLKNITSEELVSRFKKLGSTKCKPGETFDINKFFKEEMQRYFGYIESLKERKSSMRTYITFYSYFKSKNEDPNDWIKLTTFHKLERVNGREIVSPPLTAKYCKVIIPMNDKPLVCTSKTKRHNIRELTFVLNNNPVKSIYLTGECVSKLEIIH